MNDSLPSTFCFDDFPVGRDALLSFLDQARSVSPDFKATIYAVPEWMKDSDWDALESRRDFVAVGMHGFAHARTSNKLPECVSPDLWPAKAARWLPELAADRQRWSAGMFKAPWNESSLEFLELFADMCGKSCGLAIDSYVHLPLPLSEKLAKLRCWSPKDWLWRRGWIGANDHHQWSHPVYAEGNHRAKRTELNGKRIRRFLKAWRRMDNPWTFEHELTRPLLLKISLGCGKRVWPGWSCLDNVPKRQSIQLWHWPEPIPFAENSAEIIFISHFLNYLPEDAYTSLFLDCWRVLRPGGVLRLSEDEADSGRVWKSVGAFDGSGNVLKSIPSRRRVAAALQAVGFALHDARPYATMSPHKDVLAGDSRMKLYVAGQKFYLEATKDIVIKSLARPQFCDSRRRRNGTYILP